MAQLWPRIGVAMKVDVMPWNIYFPRASEIAMDDVAVMPLYFYSFSIASPKTIVYAPRLDQFTLAYNARKLR